MRKQALTVFVVIAALAGCDASEVGSADDVGGEAYAPFTPGFKADGVAFSNAPLSFPGACEEGTRITIAAVGDVLLHGRLQRQAYAHDAGFRSLWEEITPLLAAADVTYANLEGPTAAGVNKQGRAVTDPGKTFDGTVYSSYPMFNYHPSLLDDLLASGVDVVSTANNHSLDRWSLGVDRTIDALNERAMPCTGTRRSDGEGEWYAITDVAPDADTPPVRLAWIACTYGTNGIPDRNDQVLFCFDDREELLEEVRTLSARADIDAVIVTPHWGLEYHANPSEKQILLAHELADAGATAVIGSHPHVLQPWERYTTEDGRDTFIHYALGNFVSAQNHLPRRSTLLLYVGLTKTADGTVLVNGARYVPLHMTRTASNITLQAVDLHDGLGASRDLTVQMFGPWNLDPPVAGERVETAPQCDPSWTAPHPLDGWIGGECAQDAAQDVCGGALCDEAFPGGLCTEPCERYCPDRAGRAGTFCIDAGYDDVGVCVPKCLSDADCRSGWKCLVRDRFGADEAVAQVCVPVEPETL